MPFKRAVLDILDSSPYPIGARLIAKELEGRMILMSQATVGRILLDLDRDGFTENISHKGRVLSPKGKDELERLKSQEHQRLSWENMRQLLTSDDLVTLINVQEARMVIEPSLAGFAAQNATKDDIARMRKVLQKADEVASSTKDAMEYGDTFHIEIARASRKPVLEAAFHLICPQRRWNTTILGAIQDHEGKSKYLNHWDIFGAICNRDKENASEMMRMHLYGVYVALKTFLASQASRDEISNRA